MATLAMVLGYQGPDNAREMLSTYECLKANLWTSKALRESQISDLQSTSGCSLTGEIPMIRPTPEAAHAMPWATLKK
ncbi:hypothetical protein Tco_0205491 [Tanacetum coccineum]